MDSIGSEGIDEDEDDVQILARSESPEIFDPPPGCVRPYPFEL